MLPSARATDRDFRLGSGAEAAIEIVHEGRARTAVSLAVDDWSAVTSRDRAEPRASAR